MDKIERTIDLDIKEEVQIIYEYIQITNTINVYLYDTGWKIKTLLASFDNNLRWGGAVPEHLNEFFILSKFYPKIPRYFRKFQREFYDKDFNQEFTRKFNCFKRRINIQITKFNNKINVR